MTYAKLFIGFAFLSALLMAGCGLLGSDDGDRPVQIRISNQTGFDINSHDFRISIGDSSIYQVFNFEFSELPDGETGEYVHIPVTTDNITNITGYRIRLTMNAEEVGFYRFSLNSASDDENRAAPIRSGKYTYVLEYTSHDFVYYDTTQDAINQEEVRLSVRNTDGQDFDQVSFWLRIEERSIGEEVKIGPVAAGQQSSYRTVENAVQFTRIRVVTASRDTVDNEPLELFGNNLPPGDYTYHVEVRTDDLHDHSRIVKD